MPDSSLRSRMTGKYLIPFYKTHSDISTHTYFRSFMFTHTCPFRRLRRHLPRSRGRLFCESFPYFSILLILFSILLCLPTLTPFVNLSVDTLAKAKRLTHFYSVAPLLEKRFACFPTSGDSLRFIFFSSSPKSHSTPHRNAIHFCRHSWAVGRTGMMMEEKHNMTLSEESGIE